MKSLWYKIGLGYFLLVCIIVAISVVAVYNFSRLNDFIGRIVHNNIEGVMAAENMVVWLERQENAHASMMRDDIDSSYTAFGIDVSAFRAWHKRAVDVSTDSSEIILLEGIHSDYNEYVALTDTLYNILQLRNGRKKGLDYTATTLRPISSRLKQECTTLVNNNERAAKSTEALIKSTVTDATFAVVVASLIAVALSILASVRITRAVKTPAQKLTQSVRQIGQGHLNQKIDVTTDDEIGELAAEFNKMTERLRHYEELNIHQLVGEKKKSETIVESIADPIIVTDNRGGVILMNRAAADVLEVNADEVAGRSLSTVVKDELWARKLSTGSVEQPESLQRNALLRLEAKGKSYYFRPRQTKILDDTGGAAGIITLLQDVTRFKDLDEMKTEFLATVSHEFRTPLTSINMTVDILSREVVGSVNQRQRDLLNAAKDDCDRLGKLIKELLDLSKLESGKQEMRMEKINVKELLEESIKPLRLPFQEKHISLALEIANNVQDFTGDRQQLSWVITNLANNALRFTPEEGSVRISARGQRDGICFSVTDTGPGIPEQSRESIFDKFVQVKEPAETTPGSVGLGLAIAREVVEAHRGRIWVESVEGKGSTFFVTIPAKG